MIATCPRCATGAIRLPNGDYLFPCKCGMDAEDIEDVYMPSSPVSLSDETVSSSGSASVADISASDRGLLGHIVSSLRFRRVFYAVDLGFRRLLYFFHFLSAFLLACSFYLVVFFSFPEAVTRMLPGTVSVYEFLGMRVSVSDFAIEDMVLTKHVGTDPVSLVITGRVLNMSGLGRIVPDIHYSLHDENGQSLYAWSHGVASPVLGPGGSSSFSTRLSSFPDYASYVRVGFSRGEAFDMMDIR